MNMFFNLAILMFGVSVLLAEEDTLLCKKGQYRHIGTERSICQPCPERSFMDKDDHEYIECKTCNEYLLEIDLVEEWDPCTRQRDSVVRRCVETMFVHYNRFEERDECIKCRATDCPERIECCDNTSTTAASTPDSIAGSLGTSSLPTDTGSQNLTKCDDIASEGCLGKEFINKTCFYVIDLIEQSLLCQNCPKYSNMTVCSDTPKETVNRVTVSSELSSGEIVAIILGCVIFVAMFGAGMWFCYRRATSQTYRTYEMTIGENTSLNKKNEQKSTNTRKPTSNYYGKEAETSEV